MIKNKTITAIIPVRKGSKRILNKNTKDLLDTNLLVMKIEKLKQLKAIDKILVSTDCPIAIEICEKMKIDYKTRPEYYTSDDCPGSENLQFLATQCETDLVLYSPVTSPFVSKETYKNIFSIYEKNDYDSVITVENIKEYIWSDKGPINYNPYDCPRSQDMEEYFKITFGTCLIEKNMMISKRYIVGDKPFWYKIKGQEALDIDEEIEFSFAKTLHEENNSSVIQNKKIQILDCTIRDGGFTNNHNFSRQYVEECLKLSSDSGISFFEMGYLTKKELVTKNTGVWKHLDYSLINKIVEKIKPKCKISVMLDSWRFDVEDLPPKKENKIDLIRVCAYEEQLNQAIEQCKIIKNKGYECSLNIICISYLETSFFKMLKQKLFYNDYLDYLCFADSYGSVKPKKVKEIITMFRNISPTTKIGFHGHDNLGLAMMNSIEAINAGADLIDGSYHGLGRGGGNLCLESILLYLYNNKKIKINLEPILLFFETKAKKEWKENFKHCMAGLLNVHPYRLNNLEDKSLHEVYEYLKKMSVEFKRRI